MSDSAIIIRDDVDTHRLLMSHRDWGLLWGPSFAEGPTFGSAFGVFENFTIAGGIPKGSQVKRRGQTLHGATATLLAGIKRDYELLRYDYSYKVANEPKRYGGGQGINVGGRVGILSLRPKGYCSISILGGSNGPPRVVEVIDLRTLEPIATDSGPVQAYRRKAATRWLETLPPLLDFLTPRLERKLAVEHIERAR